MSESSSAVAQLSTPAKKRRNANFSKEEVVCLVAEYGKRVNVLNFGNREQKNKCWEEITTEMNTLHDGFQRNVEEIKKKWIDLLYATKKEYIKATKAAAEAGEPERRKLNDVLEMVVKVRGGFSSKRGKNKPTNGVHIISLGIPNCDGTEQPTTIYIPHVDECQSNSVDCDQMGEQNAVMIPDTNYNDVHVQQGDSIRIEAVESYDPYHASGPPSSPLNQSARCSCGLSGDLIRLKQETLGVLRRRIQIEEERRIEEKQRWWEEKQILRLKKQKLELQIKSMQQLQKQTVSSPTVPVQQPATSNSSTNSTPAS